LRAVIGSRTWIGFRCPCPGTGQLQGQSKRTGRAHRDSRETRAGDPIWPPLLCSLPWTPNPLGPPALHLAKDSFDLRFRPQPAELAERPPRAILLKALQPDDPSLLYPEIGPFDEIESLARTAGLEVVGRVSQKRPKPHPGTYVGKGKVEEAGELADRLDAAVIVVDDPISPSQGKNLEDRTERRVIDRAELIMDIFATRARTHQAKLQVELAQLRYSQSRLTRMWTHLSRFEGGIGMRGPGETQLETDRRIIRRKIGLLKERLAEIERQHSTQNKARELAYKVALVGYTNAGKSTLMRRLTQTDVLVENRLFSTLDTSTRRWDLATTRDVILSDTVGFIRKLPHALVASFHATLAEAREADLLLHVVDASSPRAESDIEIVEETLESVGCGDNHRIFIFNKVDRVGDERRIDVQHLLARHDESIAVSAIEGHGVDRLRSFVIAEVEATEARCEFSLPTNRGDLAHQIRLLGKIEEERFETDRILLRVRLTPEARDRCQQLLARAGLSSSMDGTGC
ncbi:MAG: GTPase HflX, partial [Planctomycetes bacterium]|nr:GTPase HflX [Planctomycetota bacterium]